MRFDPRMKIKFGLYLWTVILLLLLSSVALFADDGGEDFEIQSELKFKFKGSYKNLFVCQKTVLLA